MAEAVKPDPVPLASPATQVSVVEVSFPVPVCKPSPEPDVDPAWPCWIGAAGVAFTSDPAAGLARDAVWFVLGGDDTRVDGALCAQGHPVVSAPPESKERAVQVCEGSGAGECTVVLLSAVVAEGGGESPSPSTLGYLAAATADARAVVFVGAGAPLQCDDALRAAVGTAVEPAVWAAEEGPHLALPRAVRRVLGVQLAPVWAAAWSAEGLRTLLGYMPPEFRTGPLGGLGSLPSREPAAAFAAPHARCGIDKKCVVSYSLYGADAKYTEGALENAKLAPIIFSGWDLRFVHDETTPEEQLAPLRALGCEVISVATLGLNPQTLGAKMVWRFLIADDASVDVFSVRDSDSRISFREREAVREFIDSDALYHVLRDHQSHNYAMNGGMWGGKRNAALNIGQLIGGGGVGGGYFADMSFLASVVWPVIQDQHLAHDSKHCAGWPHAKGFPTKRSARNEHVGGVFDSNNGMRMSDVTPFNFASPPQCESPKELAEVLHDV